MKNKNSSKKNRLLKIFGFSVLFASVATCAITLPILVNKNKKYSLNTNFASNYEGNKEKVNYFIDQVMSPNYYKLSGSLTVVGKKGLIGETGVKLTTSQRSLISIDDAIENDLFDFNFVDTTILYQMVRVYGIQYSLEYIKPYPSDSSYPVVGLKLYAGEGSSYYEAIFEYRDTSLYGFKKVPEQLILENIAINIEEDPKNYFQLKESVGKIGDIGIYAKNIKTSDLNTNTSISQELRNKNIYIQISSVSVDSSNPSILKLNYILNFKTENRIIQISKSVNLDGFDIEQGVDDPVSKLKNFILDNSDWINNLYQYFTFEKDENDDNEYSAREAYKNGMITYEGTSSIANKLETNGITLEFKSYNEEQEYIKQTNKTNELSVLNNANDSSTPMYRIYLTSYANTPMAYTESILIEGLSQEGEFKVSEQEIKMDVLNEYLIQEGKGFEDILKLDTTNPIPLNRQYFKHLSIQNGVYSIPFELVNTLYTKYIEEENTISQKYDAPFDDKFKFIWNDNVEGTLDTSFSYGEQLYNINDIVNEIIISSNNTDSWREQVVSLDDRSISFNMSIGSNTDGNLYTNIDNLEIDITSLFENKTTYLQNELKRIKAEIENQKNNIVINLANNLSNKETIKTWLLERKFESIFSSASIYNTNVQVYYPELISPLEITIDFDYFLRLNNQELEQIVENEEIEIRIQLTIEKTTEFIELTKTFDQLINKN